MAGSSWKPTAARSFEQDGPDSSLDTEVNIDLMGLWDRIEIGYLCVIVWQMKNGINPKIFQIKIYLLLSEPILSTTVVEWCVKWNSFQ